MSLQDHELGHETDADVIDANDHVLVDRPEPDRHTTCATNVYEETWRLERLGQGMLKLTEAEIHRLYGLVAEQDSRKSDRHENEAVKIIGRVRGGGNVEKVDAFTNHDPFGIADVIAVGDGPVLFVQVKTNRFTAADRRKYLRKMHRLGFDHTRFEVWVRVDREGWRMHRYNPETESFEQYIEMDTCDHEATVEAYREAEGYYDDQERDQDGE